MVMKGENDICKTSPLETNAKIDANSEISFDSLLNELDLMKNQLSGVIRNVKHLKKNYHKRKNTNIKSGFVKPVNVSKELSTFLEIEENDKIARSIVNRKINEYIKANNLQVPEFKQTFKLDDKLSTVFNLETGTVVNYFKMQTHLKHHYPKTELIAVL